MLFTLYTVRLTVPPPTKSINHTKLTLKNPPPKYHHTLHANTLHAMEQFNQYNYLARITKSTNLSEKQDL